MNPLPEILFMEIEREREPIAGSPLSLILTMPDDGAPCLKALQDWVTFLNGSNIDYELLLAGERADLKLAEQAGKYARAKLIEAKPPAGFGSALRACLKKARHPLLAYARCDGSVKPAELKQLLRDIDKVDIVVSRRPGYRYSWSEKCHRFVARWLFGLQLADPLSMFVLARREFFRRIPIQSDGVFAHLEVMAKANFIGCLCMEARINPLPPATPAGTEPILADLRRVFSRPDFGPARLK